MAYAGGSAFFGELILYDLTVFKNNDAVCKFGYIGLMRYDNNGIAFFAVKLCKYLHDFDR